MKAVGLLSGGLDSTLAVKLMLEQGIDVVALNFTSPFCLCNQKGKCASFEAAKKLNVPLKIIPKGEEFLKVIRNPKHGYGKNMNPCIDCRIFMLKKAKEFAKKIKAKFIFTGEVLNQRPMSQHKKALELIEKEAGLKSSILRPLSAKFLPETIPEKKGWVNREKLLAIKGRSRNEQIKLAKSFDIKNYPCPAGGCLLTYKEFSLKLKDLFKHNKKVSFKDIEILKIGRHFRFCKNKIVVGRNEEENKKLLKLKNRTDFIFEVPDTGSPITLLQGKKTKDAIKISAGLTARYSDSKEKEVLVKYGKSLNKSIKIEKLGEEEINKLRI